MTVMLKNGVFWDVTPCGSLRTDVSAELSASIVRVTKITILVNTNDGGAKLLRNVGSYKSHTA
jgi:hypothetical protein